MPVLTGRRALLQLLRQEGVEVLFGNPGTTELPLMDALAAEDDLRYVLGLQEAAVMAMADGYARAAGRLAMVNLHAAPGLGNALGMLYDAQQAGAPLLVTAGQQDQGYAASEPFLWADLPTIARPFVKWSGEVQRLADLPRLICRAAKTALTPPTGPVFLSLPADILQAEAALELPPPTRIAPRLRGDPAAIEAAAALLAAARRPVVIAGRAVAQSGALAELVALAELIGAPVFAEPVASTASFPASHPLFRGALTRTGPAISRALADHDLLFSVGGDLFTLSLPSAVDPLPAGLPIVHLDLDPWELGKNYAEAVAILGDPKATLPDITAAVRRHLSGPAAAAAVQRLAAESRIGRQTLDALQAEAQVHRATRPIRPLALMAAIGQMLPDDAVVVEEAISSGHGLRRLLRSDDPQSFFGLCGGGIGWGLPAAIGVKLALPRRPVVALVGDGSALYTIQALWTAAHDRIAVVFVVLNNASYRVLKQRVGGLQGHAAQTGRYVGMDLDDPAIDFVALARSFGVAATRATTVDEATAMLAAGLRDGGPLLIDVTLDRALDVV
jgi:benzoylformate decarboxylase